MSNYATVWYGTVAIGAGPIAAGLAVCPVGDGTYVIATSANRTLYGRAVGIAKTTADDGKAFQFQVAGPVLIAGLGTGAVYDYVRVDANGELERTASPAGSDDIIGRCNATTASMVVMPCSTPVGGGSAPSGTGFVTVTGGVFDAAAVGFTGTGSVVRANTPTLVTPEIGVATGTSLDLTQGIEIGHNFALTSRTSGGIPINLIKIQTSGETIIVGNASQNMVLDAGFIGGYNEARGDTFRVVDRTGVTIRFQVTSAGARFVDAGGNHDLTLAVADLSADRTVTVPALTAAAYMMTAPTALGTAGQVLRTNSGATATEWSTFAGAGVVNVMDYYEVADGGATFNLGGVSVTTKNVANAFQAAYEDKIVTGQAFTLWLPPAADYGVLAYSWKEPLTWQVNEDNDNVAGFEIVGSGFASAIIPDSSVANNDKLYIAGGGPDCLSMLFAYRRMFWVGNEDATGGNDCTSVLKVSVDMDVLMDECVFYSVQSSSATSGVVHWDTMGGTMQRCYFHGCGNDNNGAVVYVGSGCFGATFNHVQWYAWEKGSNPFGGTHYDKGADTGNHYEVIIAGGGSLQTASRVKFNECTWANGGCFGAVKCEPGGGGTYLIDWVHLKCCTIYGSTQRTLQCVANVRHAIIEECSISHNDGGVPTIDMEASTCERLSIIRTEFSHADLDIHADNSQLLVEIVASEGGTYKVDSATHFTVDAASTWHGLSSATAAPAARTPKTDITKSDATDLTLTATQYAYERIRVTGTPGGNFNIIGPSGATADTTRFLITNGTPSQLTIKKTAGTGIAIATTKTALVEYNHASGDYIRLTADA